MTTRRKRIPKGYKVKREGRVTMHDKMYSTLLEGTWVKPSAFMLGKNVNMFVTVVTPRYETVEI